MVFAERWMPSAIGLEDFLVDGQVMQGLSKPPFLESLLRNAARNPDGCVQVSMRLTQKDIDPTYQQTASLSSCRPI